MNNRCILICGATGFIGRNLVNFFGQKKDQKIKAVYNVRPPFDVAHLPADIEWVKADLREPNDVDRVMQGVSIVVQAAATTSGAKDILSKPYIHVTDNAVMNSLLLRSAYHNAVQHFVFFSCTVMYQSSEKSLAETDFNSSTPIHPRYFGVGNTKVYIEKMLEFFSEISGMKTTAIRHSNIYGPYDKFDFERSHVFGATISKVMIAQDEVIVWGTGEEERDLLYVDDLCDFVEKAILKQKDKHRVYNCGLGDKISIRSLVQLIIEKSGKPLSVRHDTMQPTIKTSLFLNCELAFKELAWVPTIGIEEGVERTINWWQSNIDPQSLGVKS